MGIGAKIYAALVIKNMSDGYGQRFVAAVTDIFVLRELLFLPGAGHGRFVSTFKKPVFIIRHDQGAVISGFRMQIRAVLLLCGAASFPGRRLQAEQLCHIQHDLREIRFIFLVNRYIIGIKFCIGDFLVFKIL